MATQRISGLTKTPITYADSGVDIDRADRAKQRIKYLAHRTYTAGVVSEIGGFGGMFAIDKKKFRDPVLVSSVDGVGTKLKVAFMMKLHHTVGGDLVNHCVNDIAVQGATPLFFMDYLATGKLDPTIAERVVEGMAEACRHNGCALIGGETAEMPGFYPEGEYDLAGFIVGVVERSRIITGEKVDIGDVLIGLPSVGLHTNGYSLARKLLFEVARYTPETFVGEMKGKAGNELMKPHKSYWPALKRLIAADLIHAMAHITGGGITDNLPRVLPKGTAAQVEMGSWPVLPMFTHMQKIG
ncbi:MAG TPA: phosphoribosylformylglycinamidine cyclo-ligase, partial [Alphaproteobacteria bacterium]|nr:phosphoribosylformylglycinamidine cyclo-ligase [Alphaproteobacteria bacterium]